MLDVKTEVMKSEILPGSQIVNPCSEIKIKSYISGELLHDE